jgi:nucleotide-binding universal stress UspA family protein
MELHVDQIGDHLVAVGVDGSAQSLAAARYAVHAATDSGRDVLLVHAYEMPSISVPMEQAILDDCRERAQKLVADAAAQLVVPPNMGIETLIEPDVPTGLLLQISHKVPFLALGQDHLTWGERLMFSRVASRVAQRCDCPLAVVPNGWWATKTGTHHPVVIALEGTDPARAALQMAFQQAALLGTGLVALHASPYGSSASEVTRQEASLKDLLAGWKQDYPNVQVDSLVVLGDQDANLLRWSKSAAALVLERPHRHWWNRWTHSVVSAVLKETHCPLIIVPEESAS